MAKKPKDLTPRHFEIIPSKEKIVTPEEGESAGLGGRIGGMGSKTIKNVNEMVEVVEGIEDSFDANGNLVKDVINARMDTQSKEILGDFTFGESGAIKIITDDNNGLWISPTGILGKKSGENTFTITNGGEATFSGSIVSASILSSKYETTSGNAGLKIFTEKPDTISGNTGEYFPISNNEPAAPYNGAMWTNPANAYASNGSYATAVQGGFKYTIWRSFSYLQSAIPAGATITGITVKCYAKADIVGESPNLSVRLTKNGTTIVGDTKSSNALTTEDSLVIAGAQGDLWGTTWSRDDFTSLFGVMISGSVSATPSITYSIDYIQVVVHYTVSFDDADAFLELWNGIGQNTLIYVRENTSDLYISKANLYLKGKLDVEPQGVILGNTGGKLPTTNAEPASPFNGSMWADPQNAYTNNGAYATAVTTERYTIWKGFGLYNLIPAGATITGIKVDIEGKVSSGTGGLIVDLTKDGSTVVGINKTNLTGFGTTDSIITLGGSEDLWNTTWNAEDFRERFGVMLRQSPASAVTVSVDYIQITVYYTTTDNNSIKGNILPSEDDTYNLGSSTKSFRTIYAAEIVAPFSQAGRFNVYLSTNQTILHNTWTKVQFDTEDFDADGVFDSTTNYVFNVPFTGLYLLGTSVRLDSETSAHVDSIKLIKNGSTEIAIAYSEHHRPVDTHETSVRLTFLASLASGDTIEVQAFQNTGGNSTIQAGQTYTHFWGFKLT